ncbi:MAG TPA: hypothetical protein VN612_05575 [Acidobacteriaceae bacterium]|nr:hypothetical protein [Acidobacteriaceae bacterium]
MNRRSFVSLAASAAATAVTHIGHAASDQAIKIGMPRTNGAVMPADFTGLSYESGQLYNADFFSPQNTALIRAFRDLNHSGVLRLGGHLSNITPWEGVGQTDPLQIRGVRHGIEDYWEWPLVDTSIQKNKHGMITRKAIRNLRGFLEAVNWRLIYGLNFASGSAARAADEATFVSRTMGNRLVAFVLGNEPDGYGDDPVFRAKGYNFDRYFTEWQAWVKTIRAAVPQARIAGPDTDGKIDTWVLEFARRTRGDAALITAHFYGMGPASDPSMTAARLLQKDSPALRNFIAGAHAASYAAGGTPFRMDEGNSCFGGGRPGVSDAYASALWAADFMLASAAAGFCGVNLHGGGTGVYTPIETTDPTTAGPRPVYYGMQFAQQFAQFSVAPCTITSSVNATAWIGTRGLATKLAVINKGPEALTVQLPAPFASRPVNRLVLSGPALDAKTGVLLTRDSQESRSATQLIPAYTAILFLKAGA